MGCACVNARCFPSLASSALSFNSLVVVLMIALKHMKHEFQTKTKGSHTQRQTERQNGRNHRSSKGGGGEERKVKSEACVRSFTSLQTA